MIQKAARTNLTLALAEMAFDQARTLRGAVVEVLEQDDGLFTVTVVWDDAGITLSEEELDAFERQAEEEAQTEEGEGLSRGARAGAELGSLSERFESNGKPGAIGWDSTGGFSYGSYQIAAKTGTLKHFMEFLTRDFADIALPLVAAGGAAAGLAGSEAFKQAWRQLAKDESRFEEAQHGFIQATHYDPFAQRLLAQLGLDLAARSAALRDVAWSVAVQHGPGNKVFFNALNGKPVAAMNDDAVIAAVYAERSNLMRYFPRSTPRVREALAGRFEHEKRLALAMLTSAGPVLA